MPELILTREQARQVDVLAIERYGMTGLVLMENAGRGAAEIIRDLYANELRTSGPIAICCGKGNNGGDGFVIARHLNNREIPVSVLLFCDPAKLTGDAAANYEIARRAGLPIEVFAAVADRTFDIARLQASLSGTGILVDALLGTGSHGDPRPPLDHVIDTLNSHTAPKIALDIPSGLDCDTGRPSAHTVRATHTLTFVARKIGFREATAQEYLGQVHIVDIGVPRKLLRELSL
ncbi:MAG: NAD(P)H-hydrate epimerase [Planctomycetia bacterium]|nr:NAD(P)H-hydrate epimerase [Planctomycetia bacterium]